MPSLIIRELPKSLHQRLKEEALLHHRSMAKEALAVLEQGLQRRLPRWDLLDKGPKPRLKLKGKPVDVVKIIRSFRDGKG